MKSSNTAGLVVSCFLSSRRQHNTNTVELTMGFDLQKVLSDDKHYGAFVCIICENLASLDAVVTSRCSHLFCRDCLLQYLGKNPKECLCPDCKEDLTAKDPSVAKMNLGMVYVAALPLSESQPLAHKVLAMVQVSCLDSQHVGPGCDWCGDYSQFFHHASCHSKNGLHAFIRPSLESPVRGPTSGKGTMRPAMGLRANSLPALIEGTKHDTTEENLNVLLSPKAQIRAMSRSLRNLAFTEDDADETNTTMTGDTFPELYNAACINATIAQSPPREKQPSIPAEKKVVGADPFARKKMMLTSKMHSSETELETSYSRALDWNASIASFKGNVSANDFGTSGSNFDDSVNLNSSLGNSSPEAPGFDLDMEIEPDDQVDFREKREQAFKKAVKLKKQANGKFNRGDFIEAREIYTEGLETVADFDCETKEDHLLVSNMFSNRAVTYFREKKFILCVEDCDKAISFDPSYEKSWIRKWRALMALGKFDEAFNSLEEGLKACPSSQKIEAELVKSREEKALYDGAMALVDKGEFLEARDLLRPHTRTTDNVNILYMATRIDVAIGSIESALEKVTKALRLNPKHAEGLELRGFTLFLGGDTEKGAHLLQEAYNANKENKNIRAELLHCQRTHASMSQGRASVKRGRYADAVQHFSDAIAHSGPVPPKAPLYSIIRLERAEANLLRREFDDALKDCAEVIDMNKENATAWTIRADVLVASKRLKQAEEELSMIRKSWGYDNPTIEEGWKRVDFESKVHFAAENLAVFMHELDKGSTEHLEMMKNCIDLRDENSNKKDELKGSLHSSRQPRRRRLKPGVENKTPEKHRSRPREPKSPFRRKAALATSSGSSTTGSSSPRKSTRRKLVKKGETTPSGVTSSSPKRSIPAQPIPVETN